MRRRVEKCVLSTNPPTSSILAMAKCPSQSRSQTVSCKTKNVCQSPAIRELSLHNQCKISRADLISAKANTAIVKCRQKVASLESSGSGDHVERAISGAENSLWKLTRNLAMPNTSHAEMSAVILARLLKNCWLVPFRSVFWFAQK